MAALGYTQVTAARLRDVAGNLITAATATFTPNYPFRTGGLNGPTAKSPVSTPVMNGYVSIVLADTSLTHPLNVSYSLVVTDDVSDEVILQEGYGTLQPSGANWSLDEYIPLVPPVGVIVTGPAGSKGDTGSPGNFGPVVKTASQLGCAMDGVTDDAPTLNAFLAGATASSPHVLLVDGWLAVSRIILSPNGYTTISGMGDQTGFFLLPNTNQSVIGLNAAVGNGTASAAVTTYDPGTAAPTIAATHVLLENFRIDGNRANNPSYFFGIDIVSCSNFRIENVTLDHVSKYSIRLGNVKQFAVDKCRLRSFLDSEPVTAINGDGIHVNGPAADGTISNCYGRTGDDFIAFNCPEGYSGTIERMSVINCVLNGCQTGVRLYANSADSSLGLLNNITIQGLTGTVNVAAFVVGIETAHTPANVDSIRNILISKINVSGPRFMLVSDNIGSMSISDVTWSEALYPAGLVQAWMNNTTWSNLSIRNVRLLRDSVGNGQNCIIDTVTMTASGQTVNIGQLYISDVSVEDLGAGATPHDYPGIPLLNLRSGTFVSQLTFSGLSLRIGSLLWISGTPAAPSAYPTYVSTVASADLIRMFNPIPDSVAYLGTIYHSSDHGNALSINSNGTRSTIGLTAH